MPLWCALLLSLSLPAGAQPGASTTTVQGPALRLVPEAELPDLNETLKSKKDLLKAAA